jgi:hypothetical protein
MKTTFIMKKSQHIKLNYLYRNAENRTISGFVIFSNPEHLSLEEVEESIKNNLINGVYIDAPKWKIPDLFCSISGMIAQGWCEFGGVEFSNEPFNDKRSISGFLKETERRQPELKES